MQHAAPLEVKAGLQALLLQAFLLLVLQFIEGAHVDVDAEAHG